MSAPASELDPEAEAAAAALASLRAAVRQRQGELAAVGGTGDDLAVSLAELRRREFVQEPRPVSPRPGVGALIVFVRKAAYHLFAKWHARAVLQQQNEFNQSAASLIAALAERERETRIELGRVRRRLEELEAAGETRAEATGGAGLDAHLDGAGSAGTHG